MDYTNVSVILANRLDESIFQKIGENSLETGLKESAEIIKKLIRDGSIDYQREITIEDIFTKAGGDISTNSLKAVGLDVAVLMLNKKVLEESAALLIGHVKRFGEDENNLSLLSRCLYEITVEGKGYTQDESEELLLASKRGFERVLEIMPGYNDANYYLGFIYHNLGNRVKAKKCWELSIAGSSDMEFKKSMIEYLNDLDGKERFKAGTELTEMGLFDEALLELLPAYDLYSDWWELSLLIGKVYRYKDMLPEAIKYLKKSLEFNTGCVDAMNELGIIFASMGDIRMAEEYLNEAMLLEPNNPKLITNLAACNFYAGNKAKAKEMIDDVTRRFPEDEVAARWSMVLDNAKGNPIN